MIATCFPLLKRPDEEMDEGEQDPPCNEETAYHEAGHAVVGVVLGRCIQMIHGRGEEGSAEFAHSSSSPLDLLVGNVAGYVAEGLWQYESKKKQCISEIPSLETSELISSRIEANHWAGINDAAEALENARKVLNSLCNSANAITGRSASEPIFLVDEIRMAERRAVRILSRRWEAVEAIAAEVRQWGWALDDFILAALGEERIKRASDE